MNLKCFASVLPLLLIFCNSYSQSNNIKSKYTRSDTLRGELSAYRTCYDVLTYDLDIKVDIDNQFISGSNGITFVAKNNFTKLQIDLFANMEIVKIEYAGSDLTYVREYNAAFVTFPTTFQKDSVGLLKVYYTGSPQVAKNAPWDGGFTWNKDEDGNDWVGVSCQGTGASLWWPCKDHQSDEPNEMTISVTVPSKYVEVSNGRLVNVTKFQGGWKKYEWHVSYPINTYDVTINIGKYKHFKDTHSYAENKKPLTLDYFVLPANFKKAKVHFGQVKPMLDCYSKLFGEYPFVRDGYKLVETPYLGMEHQSCISYGNKYLDGYLGKDISGAGYVFDYIIIHETAHEWWGNSITTNDIADMWIHEGFGTYAEALYVECMHGNAAYLEYINHKRMRVKNNNPIVGDYGVNSKGSDDMYPKGALLLHTLRGVIDNDTLFFSVIKAIQDSFQYKTVTSQDIENFISIKSGKNLSAIFDVYLRGKSIPKLVLNIERDSTTLKVQYRYELAEPRPLTEKLFTMPAKVTFIKDEFHIIHPTFLWKTVTIYNMNAEDFKVASELYYTDVEINLVD